MTTELDDLKKKYKDFINIETPETWFQFSLPSLNRLVGKGIKGGTILQLLGDKSTGKTSLALDLVANAQKEYTCAYIDFERTYDIEYARFLGVDTDSLILVKPDTAETGFMIAEKLIEADIKLIVIDSIAAPVSNNEIEKDVTDNERMAGTAGLITRFLKRMIPKLDNSGALLILINQNRANISTMSRKESKPFGARFIQYAASTTIELARIKNGDDESIVQAYTEKNKTGGKERSKCEIVMTYGKGFDVAVDVINLAIEFHLTERKGAWYNTSVNGIDYKAQGMEQAKELFPIEQLKALVLAKLKE